MEDAHTGMLTLQQLGIFKKKMFLSIFHYQYGTLVLNWSNAMNYL